MQIKAAGQTLELWFYDSIGEDYWSGGGVTSKAVSEALRQNKGTTQIIVRMNSAGGDVFEGVAIYNLLAKHQARVEIEVDGLAASAASVIAMAGDEIRMAENAMMMIHEPWGVTVGNASDHRAMADSLEKISESLGRTYAARSGQKLAKCLEMMDAETWFTAKEAKELGFCDRVMPAKKIAASADSRILARFKRAPAELLEQPVEQPTARVAGTTTTGTLIEAAHAPKRPAPTPSQMATLTQQQRFDSWNAFSRR